MCGKRVLEVTKIKPIKNYFCLFWILLFIHNIFLELVLVVFLFYLFPGATPGFSQWSLTVFWILIDLIIVFAFFIPLFQELFRELRRILLNWWSYLWMIIWMLKKTLQFFLLSLFFIHWILILDYQVRWYKISIFTNLLRLFEQSTNFLSRLILEL